MINKIITALSDQVEVMCRLQYTILLKSVMYPGVAVIYQVAYQRKNLFFEEKCEYNKTFLLNYASYGRVKAGI